MLSGVLLLLAEGTSVRGVSIEQAMSPFIKLAERDNTTDAFALVLTKFLEASVKDHRVKVGRTSQFLSGSLVIRVLDEVEPCSFQDSEEPGLKVLVW